MKHDFKPIYFESNVLFNGFLSQIHTCRCTKCHVEDTCHDHLMPDPGDDCTEKKPAWVCPMPEKTVSRTDVDKTDYPAKRSGYEAKRRKK